MFTSAIRRLFKRGYQPASHAKRPCRRRQHLSWKPQMEALEDRCMPSVVQWTGAGNGNWSDRRNWSTGSAPGAGDQALFTNNSSVVSQDATVDISVSIAQIVMDANWTGPSA
jgi:hypothetical protein